MSEVLKTIVDNDFLREGQRSALKRWTYNQRPIKVRSREQELFTEHVDVLVIPIGGNDTNPESS